MIEFWCQIQTLQVLVWGVGGSPDQMERLSCVGVTAAEEYPSCCPNRRAVMYEMVAWMGEWKDGRADG